MNKSGQIETETFAFRSDAYAWGVVFVLCLANIVSFIDRQIINLLVEPIRADLGISDTQISLLQGFAFALFYSVMAVPIGRLADAKNRTALIAVGMVLWSAATFACGLARNFWQLFFSRMFVGVGEAALTPSGFSLLGDYFPRRRLTTAISVFTASSFLGSGIALLIGGYVISRVNAIGTLTMPVIGEIFPWQLAFIIVSLPGLLLALVVVNVREPRRLSAVSSGMDAAGHGDIMSLGEVAAYIRANLASLGPILLGFAVLAMVQFGLGAWVPTFFIRTYGWTASEIGYAYGLYFVIFGGLGVVAGGWISDWLRARGRLDGNVLVGFLAAIVGLPFVVAFPLAGDANLSLFLLAPVSFFGSLPFGAGPAALPMIVPNRMRAQITALYILIANLVGLGLGPWCIAAFSDFVLGDPMQIRFSIAVVGGILSVVGAVVLWFGLAPVRDKMSEMEITTSAQPGTPDK